MNRDCRCQQNSRKLRFGEEFPRFKISISKVDGEFSDSPKFLTIFISSGFLPIPRTYQEAGTLMGWVEVATDRLKVSRDIAKCPVFPELCAKSRGRGKRKLSQRLLLAHYIWHTTLQWPWKWGGKRRLKLSPLPHRSSVLESKVWFWSNRDWQGVCLRNGRGGSSI